MTVVNDQAQPTFDPNYNVISYYNWTGGAGAVVPNGGNGEPKAYTGLVGTHHRPSDDVVVFGEHSTAEHCKLCSIVSYCHTGARQASISQITRCWQSSWTTSLSC